MASLLLALLVTPAYADVEAGVAAYQRGDYAAALEEFGNAAKQNDPLALNVLGIMYAEGRAVARNDKLAADLFFKAQALGSLEAGANLGRMYAEGRGVPKSHAEALRHYRDAALGGYLPAMRKLAEIYERGELGVAPDQAQAQEWRTRLGGTPTGLMHLRPTARETAPPPEIPRDRKQERKPPPAANAKVEAKPSGQAAPAAPRPDKTAQFEQQVLQQLEKYRQRERRMQVASTDDSPALAEYLRSLRNLVKQGSAGAYSASPAPAGMTVSLAILRDGTLRGVAMDRGSGDARLDRTVLSALRQLARLPALPPVISDTTDVLEVTVGLPVD